MQHSKEPPEIAIIKASNRECHNLKRTARENYNYTLIHTRSIINNRTAERVTIKSTDRSCHIQNPVEGTCCMVSCVPMPEQNNDEKGNFFRTGQCAALSSFRVGKMLFLKEKGMFLTNFTEGCRTTE